MTTNKDEIAFENAIKSLEATAASMGAHLETDSTARRSYAKQINAVSNSLRADVHAGKLTWLQAADQACRTRNLLMEIIRARSTPVGRAWAEKLKPTGHPFNTIVAKKTIDVFGSGANFQRLSESQKNKVYAAIVTSSGKSNVDVNAKLAKLSAAGRGLIFISIAISTYNVLTASNKGIAIKREIAVTSAGVAGSIAAGALAGLACGPAAPACVTVGAFVGGAVAAFGAGYIW